MGKRYTEEFRESAVRLVLSGEASMRQIAAELGVDVNTLAGWKKEYCREHREPASAGQVGETMEAEVARLRRELRRVRLERDILKKALGIFSTDERREDTNS